MNIQDKQLEWMRIEYAKAIKHEIGAAPIEELAKLVIIEENDESWRFSVHPHSIFGKEDAAKLYVEYMKK